MLQRRLLAAVLSRSGLSSTYSNYTSERALCSRVHGEGNETNLPFNKSQLSSGIYNKIVGIVGIPFRYGQPRGGVEGGPALIRKQGLVPDLQNLGWHVKDYGDVSFSIVENDFIGSGIKYPRTVGHAMHKVWLKEFWKVMVSVSLCGGDHSVALGTVHGHRQVHENACVIWVDAHADLNTPATSPSGNVHGMPLAFILKELEADIQQVRETYDEWSWLKPCITAKDVVFLGLRDVDPGEQALLKKLGIKCYSMYEVDKYGIAECVKRALKYVNPNLDKPIHLSYDVDALDPSCALSTGTPVIGGLTVREGFYIAEEIAATGLLTVMDMVEVNPKLADDINSDMTANTASRIIKCCLGARIV